MVGDGALVNDLAVLIENAEGVLLVAEIKPNSDEWDFGFHGSGSLSQRSSAVAHCLLI
jgi:stress response protein SCP2